MAKRMEYNSVSSVLHILIEITFIYSFPKYSRYLLNGSSILMVEEVKIVTDLIHIRSQ